MRLLSKFSDIKIEGFVISICDKPFGILHPSTLVHENKNNIEILGPNGLLVVKEKIDSFEFISSLMENGNIIIGTSVEIKRVINLLNNPLTSRTTAYLLSVTKNCFQLVDFFREIKKMTIGIFGCGGIGSTSAIILSHLPFKGIYLIDSDIIEYSNFNRQLFWTKSDIGKPKVEVLKNHILKRNEKIKVNTCLENLNEDNLAKFIEKVDCLLFTADHPIGINNVAKAISHKKKKYFLATGYSFSTLLFDNSFKSNGEKKHWSALNNHIMPSAGAINSEGAGIASNILLQMIFYKNKSLPIENLIKNTWTKHGVY